MMEMGEILPRAVWRVSGVNDEDIKTLMILSN